MDSTQSSGHRPLQKRGGKRMFYLGQNVEAPYGRLSVYHGAWATGAEKEDRTPGPPG